MEAAVLSILAFVIGAAVAGAGVYYFVKKRFTARAIDTQAAVEALLEEARTQQKEILIEAKEEAIKIRRQVEDELRELRTDITRQERRLQTKEENLDRKLDGLEKRERQLQRREAEQEQIRQEIEALKVEQVRELERVAGLGREEAKGLLLAQIEQEIRDTASRRVREIEQEFKEEADRKAREVLAIAMQRCAPEYVAENTVTVVPLPSDEMKGRIIGREGRNIRALEQATGCDLIVDDTPEAVTLSGFDAVRREVARRALVKLIQDGRIHPARIAEVVAKAKQEVEQVIRE